MQIVLNVRIMKLISGLHKQEQGMKQKPNSIDVLSADTLGEIIDNNNLKHII